MNEKIAVLFAQLRQSLAIDSQQVGFTIFLSLTVIAILAWWAMPKRRKQKYVEDTRVKDQDFFDMVMSQKGIDGPEREAVMRLADRYGVTPIYSIVLRVSTFDAYLLRLQDQARATPDPTLRNDLDKLERARARLFPGAALPGSTRP